jgi:hypothetical protein
MSAVRADDRKEGAPVPFWRAIGVSIAVGFAYPWVLVLTDPGPDRCTGWCEWAFAYAPAPIWAVGLALFGWWRGGRSIVSLLGGVMLGIVGAGLGLLAAFVAVLILLGISGAS